MRTLSSAMRRAAQLPLMALLALPASMPGSAAEQAAPPVAPASTATARTTAAATAGCLETGDGFLRARVRGALDLDLAWRNAEMQCDGGARPDDRGLRVTIAGPQQSNGRRLRFVFGIAQTAEGAQVHARPVNVTLIFEGEQRLFATRGEDKCTMDELRQDRIGTPGANPRRWRVTGRGFCTGPATALPSGERLLVSSFDFTSVVTYEDPSHADAAPTP
jgi:hypothetical protein